MSETTTQDSTPRTGSLTALRLPQLQEMAAGLGIKGYRRLRKSELIDAINSHSGGSAEKKSVPTEKKPAAEPAAKAEKPAEKQEEKKQEPTNRRSTRRSAASASEDAPALIIEPNSEASSENESGAAQSGGAPSEESNGDQDRQRSRRSRSRSRGSESQGESRDSSGEESSDRGGNDHSGDQNRSGDQDRSDRDHRGGRDNDRRGRNNDRSDDNRGGNDRNGGNGRGNNDRDGGNDRGHRNDRGGNNDRNDRRNRNNDDDDRGNNRRGRGRDRKRRGRGNDEPDIRNDDVLIPVGGILDVHDNYAFLRTSGYLPGPNDVYLSASMVRKNGLRKGDAVAGAIRQPRENEQRNNKREKFDALVRLDSVNGLTVDDARANRVEFSEADPAVPAGAPAPRDHLEAALDPPYRSHHPHRQGPARTHRRSSEGGQDDDHAADRQRDHREQPRSAPHGRARRRAPRGSHGHAAFGRGRGYRLDLRPSGR